MESTLLNEQGWNRDAIERQLAHAERNNVRAAYNHAEFTTGTKEDDAGLGRLPGRDQVRGQNHTDRGKGLKTKADQEKITPSTPWWSATAHLVPLGPQAIAFKRHFAEQNGQQSGEKSS